MHLHISRSLPLLSHSHSVPNGAKKDAAPNVDLQGEYLP